MTSHLQYEELYNQLVRQQRDAYKDLTWHTLLVNEIQRSVA